MHSKVQALPGERKKKIPPAGRYALFQRNPKNLFPKEEWHKPALQGNSFVIGTTECRITGLGAVIELKLVTKTIQQESFRTMPTQNELYTVRVTICCLWMDRSFYHWLRRVGKTKVSPNVSFKTAAPTFVCSYNCPVHNILFQVRDLLVGLQQYNNKDLSKITAAASICPSV